MDRVFEWLGGVREALEVPLLQVGKTEITLWSVLYFAVLVAALLLFAKKLQFWVAHRLLGRTRLDASARLAVGTITRYVVLLFGFLVIVGTAGVDLTTFTVLAGAIGIGAGFGLQTVVSNFFAGLIIMLERPVKIGDRIEVGDVNGDVIEIGARATTVLTNDNIAIIVPNSKFVSENVVNWKYNDNRVRFRVPVSVAYGTDLRKVEKLLMEVAAEEKAVLENPEPNVALVEFGDSGVKFELRAWTSSLMHRRGRLVSALNFAINDKFVEHGIEIPYPQRDLHVRSGTLEVRRARTQSPP
jgi:small-conductance mechanosensitive channel